MDLQGPGKFSGPLLVSLWPFGWDEWTVSLLGLIFLELEWVLCDSPSSHFIVSKIKEFFTSPFFTLVFIVFGFSPEFPSCFKIFGIVRKHVALLTCFNYTCEIIELFQVWTYLLTLERLMWFITAQCHVMKELQTLILKQQRLQDDVFVRNHWQL